MLLMGEERQFLCPEMMADTPTAWSTLREMRAFVHHDYYICFMLFMDRFLRHLAIIAGLVLAVAGVMATALRFAYSDIPQDWWKAIVIVCGVAIAALILWFAWEIVIFIREPTRSILAQWTLRWPITRRQGWPDNAYPPSRIYNFRCAVDFSSLHEYQMALDINFFNRTYERVVLDRLSGSIRYDNLSLPRPPDTPHPVSGHAHAGEPLSPFLIRLEQRVSKSWELRKEIT
jgi:hypothetical protein